MAGSLRTGVRKQEEVCMCFMGKCIKLKKKEKPSEIKDTTEVERI